MKNDERLRFTLRLPKTLFELIKNESIKIGVSVNALILQILWKWLNQQKNDNDAS